MNRRAELSAGVAGAARAVAACLLAFGLGGCRTPVTYVSAPRDAADAIVCSRCEGTGVTRPCPQCEGTGQILRNVTVMRETTGPMGGSMPMPGKQVQVVACPACAGSGVVRGSADSAAAQTCDRCGGTGRVYRCDASGRRLPP